NSTSLLENLGFAYIRLRRFDEAERQFLRSLAILEQNGLIVSNMGVYTLYGIGRTYIGRNDADRAEPVLARAVEIGHRLRTRSPEMAETLEAYATVLRKLYRAGEAEKQHAEAVRMRAELVLTTRVGP